MPHEAMVPLMGKVRGGCFRPAVFELASNLGEYHALSCRGETSQCLIYIHIHTNPGLESHFAVEGMSDACMRAGAALIGG
jgi:hypothetical protein